MSSIEVTIDCTMSPEEALGGLSGPNGPGIALDVTIPRLASVEMLNMKDIRQLDKCTERAQRSRMKVLSIKWHRTLPSSREARKVESCIGRDSHDIQVECPCQIGVSSPVLRC